MGKEDIDLCGALHSVFLIVGNDSLWITCRSRRLMKRRLVSWYGWGIVVLHLQRWLHLNSRWHCWSSAAPTMKASHFLSPLVGLLALHSVTSRQSFQIPYKPHREWHSAVSCPPFLVPKCHMTVSNLYQIFCVYDGQFRWWSARIPNEKGKKLLTCSSAYLHITMCIPF